MHSPCSPRIAEEHCSQSAVRTVRIAAVNALSKENKNATSGFRDGDLSTGIAGIPDRKKLWDRARNYRALAERDWESRRGDSNHRWRKHHHSHESLREDPRRRVRTAVAARWGTRRQRRHRNAV